MRYFFWYSKFLLIKTASLFYGLVSKSTKRKYFLFGNGFGLYAGYPAEVFAGLLRSGVCSEEVFFVVPKRRGEDFPKEIRERLLYKYTLRWFFYAINSKAWIFSHDVSDVFPIPFPFILKVNMWHGRPIKKIGFDSVIEKKWINTKIRLKIPLPYGDWDLVVAHDSEHARIIESAWKIDSRKILLMKPPNIYMSTLCSDSSQIAPSKSKVLYAPTFRDYDYDMNFLHSQKMTSWLVRNDAIILYKPHPSKGRELSSYSQFICDGSEYTDSQLIQCVDLLITDYSSIFYDYSIAGVSSVFVWDDIEKYSLAEGLYLEKEEILEEKFFLSWEDIYGEEIKSLIDDRRFPIDVDLGVDFNFKDILKRIEIL